MSGRSWTITSEGRRPLTVNGIAKLHRQAWAKLTRETRGEWSALVTAAGIPHLNAVSITATPLHADRRSPQDVAACSPEVKAAIDGLVDAGVIPDDNARHIGTITFRAPEIVGHDGLRLTVTEEP